jgi:hypothetical protein
MKKTHQDVIDDINRDGLVLTHAVAHVKMEDPKALYPPDCKDSFPKLALAFYRRHVGEDCHPELDEKGFRRIFDLRPDLFSFDDADGQIVLHEIEDTHPIPHEKLVKILRAFDYLDAESLTLRLFVYDRYGLNKRELNIPLLTTMVGPATSG